MSEKQERKSKYSTSYVPQHGTKAGYHWHRDQQDNPCQPCHNAFKAYWVEMNKLDRRKGGKRASEYGAYHEPYNRMQVVAIYGPICHLCNESIDINISRKIGQEGWEGSLHIDHIIPLSKGGEDTIRNVKPSHAICNMRKGSTFGGNVNDRPIVT
jgi:5-methylcytosine-specific restriction endonuclease McrA